MSVPIRTSQSAELFRLYRRADELRAAMQREAELALPGSMTMARFEVLDALALSNEEVSAQELAEKVGLAPPSITHHLAFFTGGDFITVRRDPGDGRARRIALTDTGRMLHRQCMIGLSPLTTRLLKSLNTGEISHCADLLEAYVAGIEGH